MEFKIGLNSISSYKRLSYSPWHAIAEFVDNSTQSYFDNRDYLDSAGTGTDDTPLTIDITYKRRRPDFSGILIVEDNAMGMSFEELERAMHVALPPENRSGRSRYGMGLKTAASWMGNSWVVRTKRLGETIAYSVEVDVNRIANNQSRLDVHRECDQPADEHYTVVEIKDHNQQFVGRRLGLTKLHLSSMFRRDLKKKILTLRWNDEILTWDLDSDDVFLKSRQTGVPYKRHFDFNVSTDEYGTKEVKGWVGVLRSGSRARAGFSILHADRVIKGYPDSWRPGKLFGQQLHGSNDLVNQRLFGEIDLDDFEVSHTKDHIVFQGDEEEQVEDGLFENCSEYREVALEYRHGLENQRRPSDLSVGAAIDQLQSELRSSALVFWISEDLLLTDELVTDSKRTYVDHVLKRVPATFSAQVTDELLVRVYLEESSPNDPYLAIDHPKVGQIEVIINKLHPHWYQLTDTAGVLNFLRHCVYDGIAEYRARRKQARNVEILPDTIKAIKDTLLRLPFEIERQALDEKSELSDVDRPE